MIQGYSSKDSCGAEVGKISMFEKVCHEILAFKPLVLNGSALKLSEASYVDRYVDHTKIFES